MTKIKFLNRLLGELKGSVSLEIFDTWLDRAIDALCKTLLLMINEIMCSSGVPTTMNCSVDLGLKVKH